MNQNKESQLLHEKQVLIEENSKHEIKLNQLTAENDEGGKLSWTRDDEIARIEKIIEKNKQRLDEIDSLLKKKTRDVDKPKKSK